MLRERRKEGSGVVTSGGEGALTSRVTLRYFLKISLIKRNSRIGSASHLTTQAQCLPSGLMISKPCQGQAHIINSRLSGAALFIVTMPSVWELSTPQMLGKY